MYIVDLFKRMNRKSNIPVLVYLILNVIVISMIVMMVVQDETVLPYWGALLLSIVLYALSTLIALSPVGEWILRLQTGCKEIKNEAQREFIEPIFREVYDKAKVLDPSIPDDVSLYINSDEVPNAFATGRRTICITEGLLNMPVDQIKATLGHEFGHLAHKDTDLILLVSVGNVIITAFIVFIRVLIEIINIGCKFAAILIGGVDGLAASLVSSIYHLMITAVVAGLTWIWTKIGVLLVMKSSRSNEFEADEFSYRMGYGDELCALLDNICLSGGKGLFANLASSHPDKELRIAKLQELGATYEGKKYGDWQ